MKSAFFFLNKGGVWGVFRKNLLLTDLLGSQHLLEILQTSLTFKNSEKVIKKVDVSKNICDEERQCFSEVKEGYKVFCVEILTFR